MTDRGYHSIGEVLALLLEEFPDVTISKIRFLESQGLIQPERTPSGYRKFTESEVERLRYILREQRQNFLPLRIIKNRLDDSGEIMDDSTDVSRDMDMPADMPTTGHPAARATVPRVPTGRIPRPDRDITPAAAAKAARREASRHAENTESIPRDELIKRTSIDPALLRDLEKTGFVGGHEVGDTTFFDAHSFEIARTAARFRDMGIDVRHLRGWKSSSERELTLFEQRILPLLRQRNPAAREEALAMLAEFIELGADLRSALLMREVSRLTEQR
ncbi:MAG: MerR family transcriptional regulator [Actinobacteria bacterium]|nr:MerR family transcriptional regulator [Actinomycetota bacterium]